MLGLYVDSNNLNRTLRIHLLKTNSAIFWILRFVQNWTTLNPLHFQFLYYQFSLQFKLQKYILSLYVGCVNCFRIASFYENITPELTRLLDSQYNNEETQEEYLKYQFKLNLSRHQLILAAQRCLTSYLSSILEQRYYHNLRFTPIKKSYIQYDSTVL